MKSKSYTEQSAAKKILARIYGNGRGATFTPKDFHDLASHETIRATLSRLAASGTIRRLIRGVYDYPEFSARLNAPAPANPDAIARAIARNHGWTIHPEGNTALNLLALSTQVPAQWQYSSDGPTRVIHWAGGPLVFKHRSNKEISPLSPRTALLVQALKALGQQNVDGDTRARLQSAFTARELTRAVREARFVTAWVYEVIRDLAATKGDRHA